MGLHLCQLRAAITQGGVGGGVRLEWEITFISVAAVTADHLMSF